MDFLYFVFGIARRVAPNGTHRKLILDTENTMSQVESNDDIDLPKTIEEACRLLRRRFNNIKVQPISDGTRDFFPEGSIENLVSRSIMRNILSGSPESLVDYVCEKAPFAFSHFVPRGFHGHSLSELAQLLEQVGYNDTLLPLVKADPRIKWQISGHPDCGKLEDLKMDLDDFSLGPQWERIPVSFEHIKLECFDDQRRMPFVSCEEKGKETYYSAMLECRVHKKHLKTTVGVPTDAKGHFHVAVKRLRSMDEEADGKAIIEEEVKALKLARGLETEHIIKFIAHYKWKGKHFLMFPWAGRGDLRELWEKNNTPPALSKDVMLWMMGQFSGMAGAIEELHNRSGEDRQNYCRHGDIKPQNILCFGKPDDLLTQLRLVIADVGIARIHEKVTKDRSRTKPSASTIMYEAPEMGVGSSTEPKSRDIDVWSMGCVFLEFIVWLLYGYSELDLFSNDHGDKFYKIEKDETGNTAVLHPGVRHWIKHIQDNDWRCAKGTPLRSLVDLIATRLLAVAIREHPGTPPDDEVSLANGVSGIQLFVRAATVYDDALDNNRIVRMTSTELKERLQTIRDTVEASDVYDCHPKDVPLAPRSYVRQNLDVPSEGDKQVGIPKLPEAGSLAHLRILKAWIEDCDETHQCVPKGIDFLPTRLLEVTDDGFIRLVHTVPDQAKKKRYVAFSHRWGKSTWEPQFRVYNTNISQWQNGVHKAQLPQSFRDAVRITRGLDMRYLWIDSLCIIQDNTEDKIRELQRMEHVFSSAYVTIAATCATDSNDRFLKTRYKRRYVSMGRYTVCEPIDDFSKDVDQASINRRGWVLQERALSRRTIHFTSRQTYWECGGGVRCETMTRMKNPKASILSDPNFPQSLSAFVRGKRIKTFQSLYERYSGLELSFLTDRPHAIRGLETRLLDTFRTTGGFGVFDRYLHHSLLWQRPAGGELKRIEFLEGMPKPPSWSWMSYSGVIEYMKVPLGKVSWRDDIKSPFSHDGTQDGQVPQLECPVWYISDTDDGEIYLDEPERFPRPCQCVVMGKSAEQPDGADQLHYLLLVQLVEGRDIYERMGVAILKREYIHLQKSMEGRIR
ncbi:tol-like protein [Grosmannia clavigera kw1407]|uniref:Tol-like protein n=1 Tax=Grosmannia clavigera (strain kw1407 / UAMH 11150) TaxID=655863 RepID=F0XKU0_GROCL|nr:tol-like protein [Grosmannia clavigera kw1407]EFX01599.1 tol-like protein [Grosmannia clavigera kw1407]